MQVISKGMLIWHFFRYADTPIFVIADVSIFSYERISNIGLDMSPNTDIQILALKDVPGGFPKGDLLGATVALIHIAAQRFLAV